jgi:ADP-dependent phosphofructokinase/glucokinase
MLSKLNKDTNALYIHSILYVLSIYRRKIFSEHKIDTLQFGDIPLLLFSKACASSEDEVELKA